MLIGIPSTNPGGMEAAFGAHFGHCDLYTVVDVADGQVQEVRTLPSMPHQQGGCMAPVQSPHLVIIDQEIRDGNPLDLVMELLAVNAMINTTMITSMNADEWHERSEGLGMMPPISNPPTKKDALALMEAFRKMPGLT